MQNYPLSAPGVTTEGVRDAYFQAAGTWTGCNWPTSFGAGGIDLNGLKAAQATLLARATSGAEQADWLAASRWLAQVEKEAKEAEEQARTALVRAEAGRWEEAVVYARRACALASTYHDQ